MKSLIRTIQYYLRVIFDVIILVLLPLFIAILPILISVWVGNAIWMIGLLISWLPAFLMFRLTVNVYKLIDG